MIAVCCIAFVIVAAFLVFDLDSKFYPAPKQHAASIDYTETPNQTLIPESIPESVPVVSESHIQEKPTPKQSIPRVQSEPKSRLLELESKQFLLNLSGDAYVSGMVKKANLILKLAPIRGTNLEQFQIIESRIILDNSGVSVTGTGAKIQGQIITLDFVAQKVGAFSISGIMDESILDDANNKQSVILEDQDFYLVKKETPYRLNLIGTLSS